MKKLIVLILIGLSLNSLAQEKIPAVTIKTLDGKQFNTDSLLNLHKPIIISFWATWCVPCMKELDAINENYEDWKDESDFEVIAISIDDARSSSRVAPLVNTKGWEFPTYLDPNQVFKRAMNVINVPHVFLVDKDGKIVWQHTSYTDGSEFELFEKIKKLNNGEPIK